MNPTSSIAESADVTATPLHIENSEESKRWQNAFFFTLSALLLSQGLQLSNGSYDKAALFVITLSFLWCAVAVISPSLSLSRGKCELWTERLLCAGIVANLLQLFFSRPDVYRAVSPNEYSIYLSLGAVAVCLVAAKFCFSKSRFLSRGWTLLFPTLLFIHFCMGIWTIYHVPNPFIDVFVIQTDAAQALLNGQNPYTLTFADVYKSKSPYYGPGLSMDGRLLFGYVYPPLCAMMAVPGQILGDVRFSSLAAITLSGALLAYARPSKWSFLAATFFLFMPRVFYVLQSCWTEAFVIFLFCLTLFVACRKPRHTSVAFGLLMAVKQHLFLCSPLALLLFPRPWDKRQIARFFGVAVLVALAVSLPLALWNFEAFKQYAIMLNFQMPFRKDSLNYAALWMRMTGVEPSSLFGFALLIPTYFICLRRGSATPAGFAGATALFYFVFFLFGRQAFLNYYYFIFALMCAAVATASLAPADRESKTALLRTVAD